MTTIPMPEPIGYFACNPETLEPEWDEGCVCQDNIYNQEDIGAVGRAIIFSDQAEAYADARVREILGRAESQIMKMHEQAVKARVHPDQAEEGWNESCADRAIALGKAVLAIRALLPPLPGPATATEEKS